MKKYRLKMDLKNGMVFKKHSILEKLKDYPEDNYYQYNEDEQVYYAIASSIVENNPDIFELIEEPEYSIYQIKDLIKTKDGHISKILEFVYANNPSNFYDRTMIRIELDNGMEQLIPLSQIKCKVKPVELWFNLYRNSYNDMYYANDFYKSKLETERKNKNVVLSYLNYHSTHSITIYEEVEQ